MQDPFENKIAQPFFNKFWIPSEGGINNFIWSNKNYSTEKVAEKLLKDPFKKITDNSTTYSFLDTCCVNDGWTSNIWSNKNYSTKKVA